MESSKKQKIDSQKQLLEFLTKLNEKIISISIHDNIVKIYVASGKTYIFKKQNDQYIKIMERNKNKSKKENYKTKKGVVKPSFVQKITSSAIILFILASTAKTVNYYANTFETKQVLDNEYDLEESLKEENNDNIISITTTNTIVSSPLKKDETEVYYQNIPIDFEFIQSQRFIKRIETDNLYGNVIENWSERWGTSSNLMKALITQERDEKTLSNPGQLTRNICGEKIILPIINKTKEDIENGKEVDKIYIVREEPKKENYQKEEDYLVQLDLHKKQLEKSKELKQEGYEIILFSNLLGEENCYENVRIAIAFATYSNYRFNDPALGTFAYNAGYNMTKNAQLNDILNGNVGSDYTDKQYLSHVFRFLYPEEATNLKFITKPFPDNWNEMTYEQRNHYMNEEIKNKPYTYTVISLENFKEYNDEKEIGHYTRR